MTSRSRAAWLRFSRRAATSASRRSSSRAASRRAPSERSIQAWAATRPAPEAPGSRLARPASRADDATCVASRSIVSPLRRWVSSRARSSRARSSARSRSERTRSRRNVKDGRSTNGLIVRSAEDLSGWTRVGASGRSLHRFPPVLAVGLDAQPRRELAPPHRRDGDRAQAGAPLEPATLEQPAGERGAQPAGQVRAALAPVDADARERPARGAQRADVYAPPGEVALASRRHRPAAIGGVEQLPAHECVADRDTQRTGQVVVTGACLAVQLGGRGLAQ